MKKMQCDILVVGGGLTGLLACYALSLTNQNIILLDKSDLKKKTILSADLRTTAIAEGSKKFLEDIFLWSNLKEYAEPIKKIQVYDREVSNIINFQNKTNTKNLGYIVKNSILKKIILKKINLKKNIKIISNENFKKMNLRSNFVKSYTDKFLIESRLLIAADGKNSFLRKIKKTSMISKKYDHTAMVVNILHTKNHKNIAHEIFLKSGPLAILPMRSKNQIFASSVIWSNKKTHSSSLEKTDKQILLKIIEEQIFKYVGNIKKISDIKFFPLSAHLNTKFYEERFVYVGDSAHSLHPIAGQGWNLGVRDVKNILSSVKSGLELGLDPGDKYICEKYNKNSFPDAYSLYQITDKLNSIFLNENFYLKLFRNAGFKIIEKNIKLKNRITNFAMGL